VRPAGTTPQDGGSADGNGPLDTRCFYAAATVLVVVGPLNPQEVGLSSFPRSAVVSAVGARCATFTNAPIVHHRAQRVVPNWSHVSGGSGDQWLNIN
jgi:hypothetical protein